MSLGRSKVKTDPANQARILVPLGRMAHQIRRFINDQQIAVFVNNLKQVMHSSRPSPLPEFTPRSCRAARHYHLRRRLGYLRGLRKTTMRFVLVPLTWLSMPQQLAVLVNF